MNISVEDTDKRRFSDRRKSPTSIISGRYMLIGGKRKTIRREPDRESNFFLDRYSTKLLIVLLSLLSFSYIDAFLTLILIKKEIIVETNPVMAFYLDFGDLSFILAKFFFTGVSVVILCIYKNLSIAKVALVTSLIIYFLVIVYELSIINKFYPYLSKMLQ